MNDRVDKETGELLDGDGEAAEWGLNDGNAKENFALEPPTPGHVPDRVIEELCRCYREAADFAAALNDALKAQAEKHQVEPKALRMYISALCSDKREETQKVADDLTRLLET